MARNISFHTIWIVFWINIFIIREFDKAIWILLKAQICALVCANLRFEELEGKIVSHTPLIVAEIRHIDVTSQEIFLSRPCPVSIWNEGNWPFFSMWVAQNWFFLSCSDVIFSWDSLLAFYPLAIDIQLVVVSHNLVNRDVILRQKLVLF